MLMPASTLSRFWHAMDTRMWFFFQFRAKLLPKMVTKWFLTEGFAMAAEGYTMTPEQYTGENTKGHTKLTNCIRKANTTFVLPSCSHRVDIVCRQHFTRSPHEDVNCSPAGHRRSREGNTMASRRRVVSTMPKKSRKTMFAILCRTLQFWAALHFNFRNIWHHLVGTCKSYF